MAEHGIGCAIRPYCSLSILVAFPQCVWNTCFTLSLLKTIQANLVHFLFVSNVQSASCEYNFDSLVNLMAQKKLYCAIFDFLQGSIHVLFLVVS